MVIPTFPAEYRLLSAVRRYLPSRHLLMEVLTGENYASNRHPRQTVCDGEKVILETICIVPIWCAHYQELDMNFIQGFVNSKIL